MGGRGGRRAARQNQSFEATDAAEAADGGEAGDGADAGDGAEAGDGVEGALAGLGALGALAGLGVLTAPGATALATDGVEAALTTVTTESDTCCSVTVFASSTPVRPFSSLPGSTLPEPSLRSMLAAVAAAVPPRTVRPMSPAVP